MCQDGEGSVRERERRVSGKEKFAGFSRRAGQRERCVVWECREEDVNRGVKQLHGRRGNSRSAQQGHASRVL